MKVCDMQALPDPLQADDSDGQGLTACFRFGCPRFPWLINVLPRDSETIDTLKKFCRTGTIAHPKKFLFTGGNGIEYDSESIVYSCNKDRVNYGYDYH